jgi:hypothetical protein
MYDQLPVTDAYPFLCNLRIASFVELEAVSSVGKRERWKGTFTGFIACKTLKNCQIRDEGLCPGRINLISAVELYSGVFHKVKDVCPWKIEYREPEEMDDYDEDHDEEDYIPVLTTAARILFTEGLKVNKSLYIQS